MWPSLKKLLPHLVVVILFIVASVGYFHPVLQGKTIKQSDIVQYVGMSKQQTDFRKQTGSETYWTNSAFGGMPTYLLGAKYPHNYIKKLDLTLRFLPRPADYLFLYFIGIYILFLVLKVDYRLALVGALAFGFSTYLIIILGVGHNAKAHAIAYMPLVLSGIILTFRGKYVYGFLLTTVAMGLELVANHLQMTYYLLLLVICLGIAYLIDAIRKGFLVHYFKALGVLVLAVALALGLNATNILATQEYANQSTRGKSELTINPDGSPKSGDSGLSYAYITEYSYGKLESLNLFIPKFMGGGSTDSFPKKSKAVEEVRKLGASTAEARQYLDYNIPMYWGDQTYIAAPAYVGAIVIFLAILALFLVRGRFKWWVLSGILLSLFLSWGDNFAALTKFFINYVPLYDKFRAVSSIQVLLELLLPLLGIVGLHQFFSGYRSNEDKIKALKYATGIVGGLTGVFILLKSVLFSFAGPDDGIIIEQMGIPFMDAVRADRAWVMTLDAIRSLIFVLGVAGVLWLLLKDKIKSTLAIGIVGLLIVIDLVGVNTRYVNGKFLFREGNTSFVAKRQMEFPFEESSADLEIAKDDSYYRVYDLSSDPFNSGRASFFHNALGGYHAAKMSRVNDIANFYLAEGDPEILSMFNVKYIILTNKDGVPVVQPNPFANGPAWYVENVLPANNANQEIRALDSLDTKTTAVIHANDLNKLPTQDMVRDSLATIDLVTHQPNRLEYATQTSTPQLAVFSEVYYPHGWNAYIDGAPAEHFKANYALRAMVIPPGGHTIEFKFEPQVVRKGSNLALGSSILFLLLLGGAGVYTLRQQKKEPEK